jgi:predicted Na+-dependent transporter
MKISRRRKAISLISAILILIFSGFSEEWHSLFWFGIDIGYKYHQIVKHKTQIIAVIIAIGYSLFVMIRDD